LEAFQQALEKQSYAVQRMEEWKANSTEVHCHFKKIWELWKCAQFLFVGWLVG